MSRTLTKTIAAVALSAGIAAVAAAPATADPELPPTSTGSAGLDAGSALLQTGSTIFVNPLPSLAVRLVCAVYSGSAACILPH
ncbi:hypothetical protein [Nocardia sp. NPDC057668]|uniref:hypothetical protein n=1 Tax=Nocardia sp. NPDC057668 TaxID=3346202 RepID=UPI00366CAB38